MKHPLPPLNGRDVLVLGLGASGLAMARWCALAGARVTVADTRSAPPNALTLAQALPQAIRLQSAFDEALLARASWALVCRSPGIAPAQMASLARAAEAAGIPLVGELDLFAQALNTLAQPVSTDEVAGTAPYRPAILAITGTNGKTTTTALTTHLLREAGWTVKMAGNIGPSLLDELREAMDTGQWPQAWVLELSSFQLDGVKQFEPTAATVLNLSQDHLDWHGTMEAYAEAKRRVFGQNGWMILNRDDPVVIGWKPAPVTVREGNRTRVERQRTYTSFGIETPQRPGDWGLDTVNGMAWLVRALPMEDGRQKSRVDEVDSELVLQRLMPAEALSIKGRHNAANALAALALATAAGAPLAPMLHALRDYRGEPHRVEPVGMVREVEYIDDSKGTNVGATLAAITGLGVERRLVLILGGDGKGQDFQPLAPAVAQHVHAVALIGRDADTLARVLEPTGVTQFRAGSLPEAVRWCAMQALPGEAVLLSPACASLDMFKDYAHRAAVFVETVRELQQEEGTPA